MSVQALYGAEIWTGSETLFDHAILISDGQISAVVPTTDIPKDAKRIALSGGLIAPGFIDTQVNGGGGRLFNDDPSVETLAIMVAAHRQFGTTAMLPTLISDDLDVVAQAIEAVDSAIAMGMAGIIGIHIEGPFLNADKRGIHDASKFRTLDDAAIRRLSSLTKGKTLVTLAPETAPPGMIRALVDRGVIVAAGHSTANFDDMAAAQADGLSGVTHLFNAMTPMESRAPGIVGAVLSTNLYAGLIADGHHVHPASMQAAYRAKGADRIMLVTDAMPVVGSDSDSFTLGGQDIRTDEGRLISANGTLAGSNLDMASAARNAMAMIGATREDALTMASGTPAAFLGLGSKFGQIAPGYRADLVHLDHAIMVQQTWIAGVAA